MGFKMRYGDVKNLQKMSKNEFSRWVENYGKVIYQEGFTDGENSVIEDTIASQQEAITLTEDMMYDLLVSIKGISPRLANEILDKIYSYDEAGGSRRALEDLLGKKPIEYPLEE